MCSSQLTSVNLKQLGGGKSLHIEGTNDHNNTISKRKSIISRGHNEYNKIFDNS